MAKAKKKTKSSKGPVRIAALKRKAKAAVAKKKPAVRKTAQSAYRFVTKNVAGSPLETLQRAAKGLVSEVQRRISDALAGEEIGDKPNYAKMRNEWLKKRLKRSSLGKKILKK